MPLLKDSLIRRSGLAMAALSLVVLVNIGLSLTVAQSIEGSATAINMTGSLRKLTYQALAEWHQSRSVLDPAGQASRLAPLQVLDERLAHPTLLDIIPTESDHPVTEQYTRVRELWHTELQPMLERPASELAPEAAIQGVQTFMVELEALVGLLEERTEARIQLMRLVQAVSLVLTFLVVILVLYDLRNSFVTPLRRLLEVARAVAKRDFSQHSNLHGSDELGQLGQALDQMTDELAASYRGLEARVEEKTQELSRNHQALQLLHNASHSLYGSSDLCEASVPLLQKLEDLLGIGPIKLFLHDRHSPEPVQAVTTYARERPYYCKDHSCNACLVTPQPLEDTPSPDRDGRRLSLPIRSANSLLGTLEVWYPKDRVLPDSSRRLLETLSDQLATAIFLQREITEQQQLTLAEERAVIARELHDSLAQSLSYLKIQVARLRKLDQNEPEENPRAAVLDELSNGLNSAYRQLRELLTTFRLKLDTPDLGTALWQTTTEFNERLPNPISLDYKLPPQMLSANEEIHVLQIVREAMSNAVKHAEASEVHVSVTFESPQVRVRVWDNGRGLPEGGSPPQHYGLIIMQDRARTLGGKMTVRNRPDGGVEAALSFVPKTRNLIASQASA